MGFGSFFKKALHFAAPIAGAYFGGPIGAALASAADSKLVDHSSWGDTLKNAGLSAAGAGLTGTNGTLFGEGGSLAGSTAGDINSGITGLFSPVRSGLSSMFSGAGNYLSNLGGSTSLSSSEGPLTSAARESISGGATSAAPSTNFLTGYLPEGGGSVAGGGTPGGFFSSIGKPGIAGEFAKGLAGDAAPSAVGSEFASGLASAPASVSFLDNPTGYLKDAITSGVKDMASPSNLLKTGLKGGLAYALAKDNASGYGELANASRASAANYQPYLMTGTRATNTLSDLYGLNGPEAAQAAMNNWQTDPGFTFARDQGIKALDASAARNGNLLSGNQMQEVQRYGTGLANQFFQQYLQNLQRSAGAGQAAAAGVGQGNIDAAATDAYLKAQKAQRANRLLDNGLAGLFA